MLEVSQRQASSLKWCSQSAGRDPPSQCTVFKGGWPACMFRNNKPFYQRLPKTWRRLRFTNAEVTELARWDSRQACLCLFDVTERVLLSTEPPFITDTCFWNTNQVLSIANIYCDQFRLPFQLLNPPLIIMKWQSYSLKMQWNITGNTSLKVHSVKKLILWDV